MNEATQLHECSVSLGRLDELMRSTPVAALARTWFLRTEALAISNAEGLASDEIRLASLLADAGPEILARADWTTRDIHVALDACADWAGASFGEQEVQQIWQVSDQSNMRQATPQFIWQIEQDAARVARAVSQRMSAPSPWAAAEALRELWTNPELMDRKGRRIALLVAPMLIRLGFGSPNVRIGIARDLLRDPDDTAVQAAEPETFPSLFFKATGEAARRAYDAIQKLQRLSTELHAAAGPQRKSGKLDLAVAAILGQPIITPGRLAKAIDVSSKGAYNLLDRLEEAQCIRQLETTGARNKAFVCYKALNL